MLIDKMKKEIQLFRINNIYKIYIKKGFFTLEDLMIETYCTRNQAFFWINKLIENNTIYKKTLGSQYVFYFNEDKNISNKRFIFKNE